jgi:HK97 family phage prohead protease
MRESRFWRVPAPEIRSTPTGDPMLTGYGAVFMRYSQNLGGFVEQIDTGAFNDVLARAGSNVTGLINHDPNWLLATTDSGTLRLTADAIGLPYEMDLDASDPDALRAMAKVRTGKMRGSSFSFSVAEGGDSWGLTEQGFPMRTLRTLSALYDVGPVTSPAYLDTQGDGAAVALRSLAEARNLNLGHLVDAAARNELRTFLQDAGTAPSEGTPIPESDPAAQHARTEEDHNRTRRRFGLPTI